MTINEDGDREWRNAAGELHREDGPAVEKADGSKVWYRNGQRHREDGPAVELADGTKEWRRYGSCHREDGPAMEWAGGLKAWWLNGQKHREDGPAVEGGRGFKDWRIAGLKLTQAQFDALPRDADGRLHSDNGPVIKTRRGRRWFWHGEHVTEMAFEAHKAAARMTGALGNALESQAPQRSRARRNRDSI